jgi:exopolysaccharide biosynthesis polyprenyl glycosylphosphotransferase
VAADRFEGAGVTLVRTGLLGSPGPRVGWGAPLTRPADAAARRSRRLPWQILAVDLVGTGIAAGLLLPVRLGSALVLVWLSALVAGGGYLPSVRAARRDVSVPARTAVAVAFAADAVGTFGWPDLRRAVFVTLAAALATAVGGRLALGRLAPGRRALGGRALGVASSSGRVVVGGGQPDLDRVCDELARVGARGIRVVATCPPPDDDGATWAGPGRQHIVDTVRAHRAAAVIALPSAELTPARIRRLAWALEATGTELLVSAGLCGVAAGRATVALAGTCPVLHVRPAELHGPRRMVKEVWERCAAALTLALLSPLVLVLLAAIRLDSRGPAIFRQTRLGRDEVPFTMLKLRTMTDGAERRVETLRAVNDADGVLFKMRADPRVTRVGELLRRYSLDELPQLWNVVRGQMSLVGPRPPLPAEVARYTADVHRRMAVKPGVTGLWQVSGRSDLPWDESVRLDLFYVDNWSLALDLSIVLRTAAAVIGHTGAY